MKSPVSWMRLALIVSVLLIVAVPKADNGKYRTTPHSSTTTGVLRTSEYAQGSCAQCHTAHGGGTVYPFGLFEENSNRLCFAASLGGCHADRPTGATSGYPAQESDRLPPGSVDPGYFEYNAAGQRVGGVQNLVRWPGRLIWEDATASPHFASPNMPSKDAFGTGACDNCHSIHGGPNSHDLLDTTYSGVTGSQNGALPQNYQLCLNCHSQFGPLGMDDTSRMIASFYDRSINPDQRSGHGFGGSGYVPASSRMPCSNCHNPHGSAGNNLGGSNSYLLSDQRPGWYGLTNIKQDNEQVRRFCFGCHRSSDGLGGGQVDGITPEGLPGEVSAHAFNATVHCYDCHGRDYGSPTGNNVHNPSDGEEPDTLSGAPSGL